MIVLNDLHACHFLAECLPWQPISYQTGVLFYLDPRSTVRLAAGLSRFSSVSRKLTACVSFHLIARPSGSKFVPFAGQAEERS